MSNIKFVTCDPPEPHHESAASELRTVEKAYWKGQHIYSVCIDPGVKNRYHIYLAHGFWIHNAFLHLEVGTLITAHEKIERMALEFEVWLRANAFRKKEQS